MNCPYKMIENMPHRLRNTIITVFVILWTIVFHYESTRAFYLNPLFQKQLPKVKFLFPPAGWIMFFNVDSQFSFAEVYAVQGKKTYPLDPHQILRTRAIGYDNIHRNVLSEVLDERTREPFCRFLQMRFPVFDNFLVTVVYYPSLTQEPYDRVQRIVYQCR